MGEATMKYAVVRVVDNDDEAEAFGPFSYRALAESFADDYQTWVSPGYGYFVVELNPVREGQKMIREELEREWKS